MASSLPSSGNAQVKVRKITNTFTGKGDVNDELQHQTRENIKLFIQDTVEPSSLHVILEKIRSGSACVTITGAPGEGKTTLGYLVLRKLQESRNIFHVSSTEQFAQVIKTSAPVILLDDIFGQTVFKETAWDQWRESLQGFFNVKRYEPTNEIGNLIIIARDCVLNSGSRDTEDPWEMLINNGNVVNISSGVVRENEEKDNILNAIANKYTVHLDSKTIKTICSIKTPHGFPHACKLFVRLYHGRISAVDFFNEPLEFLSKSLKVVMKDNIIEHIFMLMIKGDGHVLNRELRKRGYNYETTAKDLSPSYIKPVRDGYVFDHHSIFDTVALILREDNLSFIIDHCSMDFVKERVWLETPDGEKREETGAGAKLMAEIRLDEAEELARRFGKEITAGNYSDVQYHNAWKSDMFVKLVIQSMSVDELNVRDRVCDEALLEHLCKEKRVDCGKMCVQRGADVNSQGKDGWTALHHAAAYGRTEVVSALLECGADVKTQGKNGRTALHFAALSIRTEIVIALLECGADVNSQDKDGWTALQLAAGYERRAEIVSALLERGADVNITNMSGDTALDWATSSDFISLLRAAGGRTTRTHTRTRTRTRRRRLKCCIT